MRPWRLHTGVFFGAVAVAAAVTAHRLWPRSPVQVVSITGESMAPTLANGSRIIVRRVAGSDESTWCLGLCAPPGAVRHGTVVVFTVNSEGPPLMAIKRIIACCGDTIAMQAGHLVRLTAGTVQRTLPDAVTHREGPTPRSWHKRFLLNAPARYMPTSTDWGPILVPDGHYLLLGDNRNDSGDSRRFGLVPAADVLAAWRDEP